MVRILNFKDGIISGNEMRSVLEIFPQLESRFRQRKQYDEYYFDPIEVEVSIEQMHLLSEEFLVAVNWESITLR
jgi:hypothetical protein